MNDNEREALDLTSKIVNLGDKVKANTDYKSVGPAPIRLDLALASDRSIVPLDMSDLKVTALSIEQVRHVEQLLRECHERAESQIVELFRAMVTELEGRAILSEEVPMHANRVIHVKNPHIENWTWRGRVIFTVLDPFHKDEKLVADREFKQSFSPEPEHHVHLVWSVVVPRDDMTVLT